MTWATCMTATTRNRLTMPSTLPAKSAGGEICATQLNCKTSMSKMKRRATSNKEAIGSSQSIEKSCRIPRNWISVISWLPESSTSSNAWLCFATPSTSTARCVKHKNAKPKKHAAENGRASKVTPGWNDRGDFERLFRGLETTQELITYHFMINSRQNKYIYARHKN